MRGIVVLGIVGAGAYALHKSGFLPQIGPVVEAVEGGFHRVANILPMDQWSAPRDAARDRADAVKEASGGQVVPILGASETVETNPYEAMLRTNWQNVSGWAKSNVGWAAAIAKVENAPMNPALSGDNGTSHGVFQVKVATAETCYRAGYTKYPPTYETLSTVAGGVYYGTAEMERLSNLGKGGLDWIIKAYNGGAGFEQMGARYIRDREAYLRKVQRAFVGLYGEGVTA